MAGKKIGIVVGSAEFDSEKIKTLNYAKNDAEAIYSCLVDPDVGGYAKENVKKFISPTSSELNEYLSEKLQSAGYDDTVFFYYSGHGLKNKEGGLFLATRDTKPDLLRHNGGSVSTFLLQEELEECRSPRVCIILDSCFSGAYGAKGGGESDENIEEYITKLSSGTGKVVMASARSTQEAIEYDDIKHGIFTHYLLKGIEGEADARNLKNGLITPTALYLYVKDEMERDLEGRQVPFISNEGDGEFLLFKSKKRFSEFIETIRSKVEDLIADLEYFKAIDKLDEYLKKYPGSSVVEAELNKLLDKVEASMEARRADFRKKLTDAVATDKLDSKLFGEMDDLIKSEPMLIFLESHIDEKREQLRRCFTGDISVKVLNDDWIGEEESIKEEKERVAAERREKAERRRRTEEKERQRKEAQRRREDEHRAAEEKKRREAEAAQASGLSSASITAVINEPSVATVEVAVSEPKKKSNKGAIFAIVVLVLIVAGFLIPQFARNNQGNQKGKQAEQANPCARPWEEKEQVASSHIAVSTMPKKASIADNKKEISALLSEGKKLLSAKSYSLAIAKFEKVLRLDKDNKEAIIQMVHAYFSRGFLYNFKGEYDSAIIDFDKAIDINPNDGLSYNSRGLSYYNKGETDRAIMDFDKAIDIYPNYAGAYNDRGNAYYSKKDYDSAIKDFNKAIRINPKTAFYYNNRGNAYKKKGYSSSAKTDFKKACELGYSDACKEVTNSTRARN
ncbi:MAG: tetratricopeptide repeat protein [Thermodesulfobacteriota bacterium]